MFRSLPDFHHLGARTAPSAGARPRVGLNLDAPSGTVPSGTMASTVSVRAVTPTLTNLQCAVGGCSAPRSNHHTGYCEKHTASYLRRVHKNTDGIGRGLL